MNKFFTAVLATVGATVACAVPALAQVYDVNLTSTNGGTGSYHVQILRTGFDSFDVLNAQANVPPPASNNGDRLTLAFYLDAAGTTPVAISGTTVTQGGTDAARTNWGGALGADNNTWAFDGSATTALKADGSNNFASSNGPIKTLAGARQIEIELQDGKQYSATLTLATPEAASLALLVPGLLPIAWALRRRRRANA